MAAWYDPDARTGADSSEARELFIDAMAQGRGMLLLSAHLGNLELARAISRLIPGVNINALVYTQNSKKLNAMLEETSEAYRSEAHIRGGDRAGHGGAAAQQD